MLHSVRNKDKSKNIPTEDLRDFLREEDQEGHRCCIRGTRRSIRNGCGADSQDAEPWALATVATYMFRRMGLGPPPTAPPFTPAAENPSVTGSRSIRRAEKSISLLQRDRESCRLKRENRGGARTRRSCSQGVERLQWYAHGESGHPAGPRLAVLQ